MSNYFWIDEQRNKKISYDMLVKKLQQHTLRKFIRAENPFEMVLDLLTGMANGLEMTLFDSDFSDTELTSLGYDVTTISRENVFQKNVVNGYSWKALEEQIKNSGWKLWMFTSGTTGLPKKVCHTYQSLARNVKIGEKHQSDIWAFAYRLSHMAGLQVLLQALMNQNTIVYVFESRPEVVIQQLEKYKCTHISATPTFYRNILPFLNSNVFLRSITMGGERFDVSLQEAIKQKLPEVQIHNIYATTETGTLLVAKLDGFVIPERFKDKIRISENGELHIHNSLLGKFALEEEWYNTHDIVTEKDGLLYFQSRQSDLVNVGGYKVNLLEVEQEILQVEGVLDCAVKSRANSVMGNMLYAELMVSEQADKVKIKQNILVRLKQNLQAYKIPRIYKFVDSVEKTRTGKKVR